MRQAFGERRTRVLTKVATLLCSRATGRGHWDENGARVGQQSQPDELRKFVPGTKGEVDARNLRPRREPGQARPGVRQRHEVPDTYVDDVRTFFARFR